MSKKVIALSLGITTLAVVGGYATYVYAQEKEEKKIRTVHEETQSKKESIKPEKKNQPDIKKENETLQSDSREGHPTENTLRDEEKPIQPSSEHRDTEIEEIELPAKVEQEVWNEQPVSSNKSKLVVEDFKTLGDSEQVILVTTKGYGINGSQIRTFEKELGKWNEIKNIQGKIGKDGFAHEMSEEVTQSPRGKYMIGEAFGRFENPGTNLPYHQIKENDVWVDDPQSKFYNTLQQNPSNGRWNSAENMNIPAYDYGFVINYNAERIPGKGSAIFFHVSDSWTAGCTGASKQDVIDILKWINPEKQPVIIQAPEDELGNY